MAKVTDECFLHSGTFSTFSSTFITSFLLILLSNDRSLINTSNFILAPIPGPSRPPPPEASPAVLLGCRGAGALLSAC